MASRDIVSYIFEQHKKCQAYPDLTQAWSKVEEFYNKKLVFTFLSYFPAA